MKLATYKDGSRDGQLVVVSRDLGSAHYATGIATGCSRCSTTGASWRRNCRTCTTQLNAGKARHAFPFDPPQCMAPLPRAYQWADGSAYINHVELVRKARNAEVPSQLLHRPADVPGRQRRLHRPVRRRGRAQRGHGHRLRGRDRRRHRRREDGLHARAGARRHPPGHAGQRREPAQPDPGRTGQGLRLLPEQARDRLQPGGGDARRTRRRLGQGAACT